MALETPEPDPGRFKPFAYLATQNAGLYRRVMLAFVAAKRRFVVHLRSEDVLAELAADGPADPKAVADALAQLVEWGNLRADPGHEPRDERRGLPPRAVPLPAHPRRRGGRAVARGVRRAARPARSAAGGRAGGHRHGAARAPRAHAARPSRTSARTGLLLRDLVGAAPIWPRTRRRSWDRCSGRSTCTSSTAEAFRAYKDRLIEYLERFIKDLTGVGGEIAELLGRLDPGGIDRLLALVARRDAEDAAPGPGAAEDFRAQAFAAELASWHERWLGLRQWFISSPEHPSQAKLLRARARKAIPDLLAVVALLNERRAGRSDRTADFRELAVWFAAGARRGRDAPAVAGDVRPAQLPPPHGRRRHRAGAREDRSRRPRPWREAPPLMISPRLRRTGSYERRGKPNRVIDRRGQRRLLAERAAAEAEQTAAARARLVTEHPIRLSDLGHLDPDAFSLFLALLGEALSARRPGEREIRTTTGDGSLEIRLAPVPGGAIGRDPHRRRRLPRARPRPRSSTSPRPRGGSCAVSTALDAALQEARDRDLARATRAPAAPPAAASRRRPRRVPARAPARDRAARLVRSEHAAGACTSTPRSRGCSSSPSRTPTAPIRRATPRSQLAFGRRRYVLLCLALSVLERADAQITLGRLAEGIIVAAGDERLAAAGVMLRAERPRGARRPGGRRARCCSSSVCWRASRATRTRSSARPATSSTTCERRVLAVLISAPRGPSTIAAQRLRRPAARAHRRARADHRRPPHPRDPPPAHPAAARRPGRLLRRAVRGRAART